MSNNDLVWLARRENPDAQLIYKPHPDVLNKLRKKRSDPNDVRHICTVVEQNLVVSAIPRDDRPASIR